MNDYKLASHLFAPKLTEFLNGKKVRQNNVLLNSKGFRLLAKSAKSNASRLVWRQGVAAAKWHTPFLNAREEEIYKVGEIGEQMHAGVAVVQ